MTSFSFSNHPEPAVLADGEALPGDALLEIRAGFLAEWMAEAVKTGWGSGLDAAAKTVNEQLPPVLERIRFGEATATLYTFATIVDVGNQLLRASEGAAEGNVRRRLGKYMGLAESNAIINGTGTNQPLGILQAILAYGDIAAHKYTLSSETRVAALGQGLGKLEARGERASGIVMHPTDYWEMAIETLGTSGSGGWAFDAATGPRSAPVVTAWGVPVYRDVNLPVGTALAGAWADCDLYIGSEFRIDVSTEAGNRFDQNVTGFRAEEEFGFNATPYVATGKFVKILGL